ncbi:MULTISPECIES: hypothetical protein [Thiomicrorhabdus]|uniref:Cardiolipin synthase N-terminal domain-containing protein n=1 Tax=Thiomicrorhabdus heinhorstiae TaxID=2748010 RepID=A0ABS0BUG1_9GAMM|nr:MULTISPECIES: hypothetical protein [Thiomicrorhabdus]MBF6057476.1 hypothetical protein [Thiomicrorhabdus heinhorstiae]
MITYLLLIISISSIFICYQIAKVRGGNRKLWIIMAAILGPLAIPLAYYATRKPSRND